MRFVLNFEINNTHTIPSDYHSGLLSVIKNALKQFHNQHYVSLFGTTNNVKNIPKKYCFSPHVPIKSINSASILLQRPELSITLATGDPATGITLCNAFRAQLKQPHPFFAGSLVLKNIHLAPERQIINQGMVVKTLSPLLIRHHEKSINVDKYYLLTDATAMDQLRTNLALQVAHLEPSLASEVAGIQVTPLNARKVVVAHYGLMRDGNAGTYKVTGHPRLLQHIHDYGMGSHRSAGYGLFEILQEVAS